MNDLSQQPPPPPSRAAEEYRRVFADRTPQERRELAHIKRFMERLVADPQFRAKLDSHLDDPQSVAREYGIEVDPAQMRPLWHAPYTKYRKTEETIKWPLARAWDDHLARMIGHRELIRELGAADVANPSFHAWRERQMARSAHELGVSATAIVHPIAAYELSDGCSLGCWFCGISAGKFKGNWPYTDENRVLWRGVLQVMVDLFGPAAQTGFCYWGTDPSDNPDYPLFIEDHYRITGALPQTTTAAPLKDVALTRRILALQKRHPSIVNRFSIITLQVLNRVHAEFTPEELLEVELVLQNREALTNKANAGRAAERKLKLMARKRADDAPKLVDDDHSTIACVSGFLISMPSRSVKLVTPVRASEKWPLGYRVFDEAHFDSPSEFRERLESMIQRFMPDSIPGGNRVAFRDGLEYDKVDNGFSLSQGGARYDCRLYPFSAKLGELIREGRHTAGDIVGQLVSEGSDVFLIANTMQSLYDFGVLDDEPRHAGTAGQRKIDLVQAV